MTGSTLGGCQLRLGIDRLVQVPEGLFGVLREHSHQDVVDNFDLGLVHRGDFDKDILRVERDLGAVSVDDGR